PGLVDRSGSGDSAAMGDVIRHQALDDSESEHQAGRWTADAAGIDADLDGKEELIDRLDPDEGHLAVLIGLPIFRGDRLYTDKAQMPAPEYAKAHNGPRAEPLD